MTKVCHDRGVAEVSEPMCVMNEVLPRCPMCRLPMCHGRSVPCVW